MRTVITALVSTTMAILIVLAAPVAAGQKAHQKVTTPPDPPVAPPPIPPLPDITPQLPEVPRLPSIVPTARQPQRGSVPHTRGPASRPGTVNWLLIPIGVPVIYPAEATAAPPPEARAAAPSPGSLAFQVEPRNARVYVDGYYLGTVDDFSGGSGAFEAGVHRVEFIAPGYEILTALLQIAPGQTTMYRQQMSPVRAAPAGPHTFYVIPNCYAGNVAPNEQSKLPAGCDLSRLQTYSTR